MGEFLDYQGLINYDGALKNYIDNQIIEKEGYYDEITKVKDYLYEVYYSGIDYNNAYEYFASKGDINIGGCSAVRNGNFYGRNLDWLYDNEAEFIVHTPRVINRYSSIGIAGGITELTNDFVESGKYSELYKILPFQLYDGINEKGVIASMNVVPLDKGSNKSLPSGENKATVSSRMLVRYILDNFDNARGAVNFIKQHMTIYFPKSLHDMNYETHFMVADVNDTFILEFIDNATVIIENKSYITNFYLDGVEFNVDGTVYTPETQTLTENAFDTNKITEYGSGLERYNIIVNNYSSANTKAGMRSLMNQLKYTNAYTNVDNIWYTEFVDRDDDHKFTVKTTKAEYDAIMPIVRQYYTDRSRNTALTWQTVHSSVYDIKNKTLYIIVQEDEEELTYSLDMIIPAPDKGKYLHSNETTGELEWSTVSGGNSSLEDLTDVNITTPQNNQVLKYNATTEKWENGSGGSDEDKMDKNNPRGTGNFAMNLASDQKEIGINTVCFASPNIYDDWSSYEDAPNHTITYVSHTENEVVFSTDWDMDEVDEILKISILYQEDEYYYYDIFVNSIDKENKTLTCQYPIYDGDHQLDVSTVISKQLERAGKYVEVIDDSVDASGDYSFLEGVNTVANAHGVHVEGNDTAASGEYSHAEGYATNTIGNLSHAEGSNTTTYGSTSHAEGDGTVTNGYASHVEGWNTIASGDYQHVQGKFNIEDAENEYAFIIGNGTNDNNRSNGFTVDWDGNIVASGTITDGDGNILSANVQADWNQTDSSADDYIKNKPTIPTVIEDLVELNDVNISNPQNDQVLKYDSTSQKWVNGTGGGGGESGLIPVDPVDTSNINIWIQTS